MIEDDWWEVRLRIAGGRWAPWTGPYASEEEAQEFVDGLTLYGRQIAIVKCEAWVKAIL